MTTHDDVLDPVVVDALRASPRPTDHRALAVRGLRRRRRRRVAAGVGAVGLVMVLGLGGVAFRDETPASVDVVDDPPNVPAPSRSADAALTFEQVPAPPLSDRVEPMLRDLGDGRVLAVGGHDAIPGEGQRLHDGAVLDTTSLTWTAVAGLPADAGLASFVEVVEERLVLAYPVEGGGGAGLRGGGTVVDLATGERWDVPVDASLPRFVEAMAFDGETVVAMRFEPGFHDDDLVGEPQVWRWDVGAEAWERGAAPPLPLAYDPGVAVLPDRVVVAGGASADPDLPADRRSQQVRAGDPSLTHETATGDGVADAAVYDIAADEWERLPDLPHGLSLATAQSDGEQVLVAGTRRVVADGRPTAPGPRHLVVALELDDTPAGWQVVATDDTSELSVAEGWLGLGSPITSVASEQPLDEAGPGREVQVLADDGSLSVPLDRSAMAPDDLTLAEMDGRNVAAGFDHLDERYEVHQLDERGWEPLPGTPDLGRATAVAVGADGVLLGPAAPDWEPSDDWWLLTGS